MTGKPTIIVIGQEEEIQLFREANENGRPVRYVPTDSVASGAVIVVEGEEVFFYEGLWS